MYYGETSTKTCYYCQKQCGKVYQFACSHYICHICLFRHLFCYQLGDLKEHDQIDVNCKCKDGELHLTLDDIEEILTEKSYSDKCQVVDVFKGDVFCRKHPSNFVNYYCVECSQLVCRVCAKINDTEHFCHRIVPGHKLLNTLKGSISSLPLAMKTRDDFLDTFRDVCDRVKEVTEKNYTQMMEQLDEITNSMMRYKKEYEIGFKNEVSIIVKKLNLFRMFYLHYYYDLELAELSPNLNLSRYLNNISEELIDAQLTLGKTVDTKLENIRKEIDNLRKSNEKKITVEFILNPVQRTFKLEERLTNFVDNKNTITSLIQTSDELLVSSSSDLSIKFWEEDEVKGFTNVITISKMTGHVIHLKELLDGKLVTASLSDTTLRIWTKLNNTYQIHQTLNGHNQTITAIAQLKDEKLISSSKDASIIIWRNNNGLFSMMQTIVENEFAIMNLLPMIENRFAAASKDAKIRFYNETTENENQFACTQVISSADKPVFCWCQLKNGQLLISCESKLIVRWKDIYQNKQYSPVQKVERHHAAVLSIVQCKDSRVATSSRDHRIIIWKVEDKGTIVPVETISDSDHGVYNLIQLSDGRLCGVVSKKEVLIWRNRNNAY